MCLRSARPWFPASFGTCWSPRLTVRCSGPHFPGSGQSPQAPPSSEFSRSLPSEGTPDHSPAPAPSPSHLCRATPWTRRTAASRSSGESEENRHSQALPSNHIHWAPRRPSCRVSREVSVDSTGNHLPGPNHLCQESCEGQRAGASPGTGPPRPGLTAKMKRAARLLRARHTAS